MLEIIIQFFILPYKKNSFTSPNASKKGIYIYSLNMCVEELQTTVDNCLILLEDYKDKRNL